MTSRDFVYWMQGFFEIHGSAIETGNWTFDAKQVELIRRHLALVFKHEIDPSMGDAEHQATLNAIHETVKNAQKTAEDAKKAANRPHENPLIRC